jgi:hypothetical protein
MKLTAIIVLINRMYNDNLKGHEEVVKNPPNINNPSTLGSKKNIRLNHFISQKSQTTKMLALYTN